MLPRARSITRATGLIPLNRNFAYGKDWGKTQTIFPSAVNAKIDAKLEKQKLKDEKKEDTERYNEYGLREIPKKLKFWDRIEDNFTHYPVYSVTSVVLLTSIATFDLGETVLAGGMFVGTEANAVSSYLFTKYFRLLRFPVDVMMAKEMSLTMPQLTRIGVISTVLRFLDLQKPLKDFKEATENPQTHVHQALRAVDRLS
jgi:hypothetical protein